MKINIMVEQEVNLKTLVVKAKVRYWEDSSVNGVDDTEGTLMPCRNGDYWCPEIDFDTGKIMNWDQGKAANVLYKVCDAGTYFIKDDSGRLVLEKDGYVPKIMCPGGGGFGDYIEMTIDESGQIKNWKPTIDDFGQED